MSCKNFMKDSCASQGHQIQNGKGSSLGVRSSRRPIWIIRSCLAWMSYVRDMLDLLVPLILIFHHFITRFRVTLPILSLDHHTAAFTVILPLGAFRNMIIYSPNWESLIAEVAFKRLFLLFFFFFFFFSIVRYCQILPTYQKKYLSSLFSCSSCFLRHYRTCWLYLLARML